jgi:hypothetical protein
MPYPKGVTNNPYGRKKGIPNRSTAEMRDSIQAFVEHNLQKIQDDFDELDSVERLRILERFMQYIMPRYASQTAEPENQYTEPLVIITQAPCPKCNPAQ